MSAIIKTTKKESLVLTIDEIKSLAEFAGFNVSEQISEDDNETEITIETFPEKGIKDAGDKILVGFRHLAFFSEYPEEGAYPLGFPSK